MMDKEITRSDVEQFMWRKLPRNTDLYRQVADAIVADPDGQVAQWCDEIRQQIIERMDGVFASVVTAEAQSHDSEPVKTVDTVEFDLLHTELEGDESDSEGHTRSNESHQTVKAGAWFPLMLRHSKTFTILATVLIAAIGMGIYWYKQPALIAELSDQNTVVTLNSNGEVTGIPSLDGQLRLLVVAALRGEKLLPLASLPLALGTKGTAFPPMSESLLVQPYHTVVSDDRPVFRWLEINNAKSYTVRVYDSDGQQIPLGQAPVTTTEWKPSVPLTRGVVMTWDVFVDSEKGTAVLPQDATRPAFRILSELEYQRYIATMRELAGSNLALGTYLQNAALLDEAQEVFERLQTDNPESEVVRNLLNNLRSLRNN